MITQLQQSQGRALGFSVTGDVTKDDYGVTVPAVQNAISEYGTISLLIDLRDFHWEKVDAWASDLEFGKDLHTKIERMALVGDRTWQKYLTRLAQPFYTREAKYFEQMDPAWAWTKG